MTMPQYTPAGNKKNAGKSIGIIGAMDIEIEKIVSTMENHREEHAGGLVFHLGIIRERECVASVCGEGKINSAVCAQTMLLRYNPCCVINVGVAGGIGEGIAIGDLVAASSVVQHDFDVTALGYKLGEIPSLKEVYLPTDTTLTDLALECAAKVYPGGLHKGVIASGDQFIAGPETFKRIREQFGALACEMEGASIGQVCVMNQVPFTVLRAISDNGDSTAHVDYPQFAREAAEKSQKLMVELIGRLPEA